MRILELVVEPDREEHIARHGVTLNEVEEVIYSGPHITRSRDGRYRVIGRTESGRYLTIILGPRGHGVFGLITARSSTMPNAGEHLEAFGTE